MTRGDRFIKTAVAILRETGRTDFTVQEVVARSKTSLRAFYQHFSSKDELLLALFERTMAQSAQAWRAETTGLDSTSAIKLIIDRISAATRVEHPGQPQSGDESLQPAPGRDPAPRLCPGALPAARSDSRHRASAASPKESSDPASMSGAAAAIVMQTILGALRLHWLGAELTGTPIDAGHLYDFCSPRARHPTTPTKNRRRRRWPSCSTRSACARAPATANSR